MTGAKIQLAMKGSQDHYLTHKPEYNLFKNKYRSYTDYATQTMELEFNTVGFNLVSVCDLLLDADLLLDVKIRIQLPSLNIHKTLKKQTKCSKETDIKCFCDKCHVKTADLTFGWTNSIGHVLLEEYSLNIGGKQINKGTGEWLEWWSEFAQPLDKKNTYYEMVGKREPPTFKPTTFSDSLELIFPLNFFFTGKIGSAIPLCCLDEKSLNIVVKWRNFADCWICNKPNEKPELTPNFKASLIVEYAYLSREVKERLFINQNHLYIIEQVQRSPPTYFNRHEKCILLDLPFSQPTKAIYWAIRRIDAMTRSNDTDKDFTYGNDWFNYSCFKSRTGQIKDPFKSACLLLDGTTRDSELPAKIYRLTKPYDCHSHSASNYLYVMPFCLRVEELQPTGTINLSMFSKIKLKIDMIEDYPCDYDVTSYALSYNWLIIKNGKVAIAFAL